MKCPNEPISSNESDFPKILEGTVNSKIQKKSNGMSLSEFLPICLFSLQLPHSILLVDICEVTFNMSDLMALYETC